MSYVKFEKLNLKTHSEFNERWVQDRVAEDPSILGLGDVILKDKERIQPRAGRRDLLLVLLKWGQESIAKWPGGCCALLTLDPISKTRPDVLAEWDDSEISRRWLLLCPERRDKHSNSEEPSEFELNHICSNMAKLKVVRSRLSDISWWMRLLSQNIAQRANKEEARSAAERIARIKA